mmetsp:Transcript_154746/g.475429  ORF Transcript_154746/g.475429 Transcript_154746/m.475429 type:complete len:110 (-) Transcript_154746:7-336(-)
MFGRGVYFADTPMKSWQYSKKGRYMLRCNVALGSVRQTYTAWNRIDPNRDLQRGWLPSMVGAKPYNSVEAMPRSKGGVVNVPEFTVYQAERAVPEYLLRLQERREPQLP